MRLVGGGGPYIRLAELSSGHCQIFGVSYNGYFILLTFDGRIFDNRNLITNIGRVQAINRFFASRAGS